MRAFKTLVALILFLTASSRYAGAIGYSVWLRAHPQAIVADGLSSTTISAEVTDSSGKPVADGTSVEFTASLGLIESRATTVAGVARVRLTSGTNTGTSVVSAVVPGGNAVAQLRVDFLEIGTEMFDESFISVSSDTYLGYDVGKRVVDGVGGVVVYHRGLTIQADSVRIDVDRSVLRARAKLGGQNIMIRRGDKTVSASALYYSFSSMRGTLLTPAEDGAQRKTFRGRDLFVEDDVEPDRLASFDFVPITESSMFIKARSLVIRPGEEIKVKRATFYLEGDKVLSVPLYVVRLSDSSGGIGQMLTYGTDGLRLDLPFYYSLTPNGTGAIRLRHSEPGGWGYYGGRSGWQVDVEHEYNYNGATDGMFSLNRVTSSDWGLRWNQRKEMADDSRLYTYIDFPAHRDLYGNADFSKPLGNYNLTLNFRGSKLRYRDPRYFTSAYVQSKPKPLFNGAVNYALTTRCSYDSFLSGSYDRFGTGLGLQFYGKPIQLGSGSRISTSMTVARDWGGSSPGLSLYANAGYWRFLGKIGQLGLHYSFSKSDAAYGYSSQQVSSDLILNPSKNWSARLYLTHGLNGGNTSAFGEMSFMVAPTWRLQFLGTYQKFWSYSYTDAEIALAKAIGKQEARLIWSKVYRRLRFEFSALSF